MKYILHQRLVGMSWLQNALFVTVRSERELSAAILVAKLTFIESFEEDTLILQQISKHVVADNPIWRHTTVRNARAGKNESQQKSNSLREHKRVNESSRVQLPSIVIKI